MTYSELLQQREWIEKSASIIQRDSFRCQECGSIGYHSMSMYICKDTQDLDKIFEGWSFNGLLLSEFINMEIQNHSDSEIEKIGHYTATKDYTLSNDKESKSDEYSFYRISSSVLALDSINRNAYSCCKKLPDENPIYHRHFVNKTTDNFLAGGLIIKSHGKKNEYFEWGNTYIYDKNLTENHIVTMEYIFPTGPNGVAYEYPVTIYGSIVFSISYKNFVGSFYFIPKEMKGLNVHHRYYIKGKAPWEYEDDALITLCEDCHKKAHLTHIPVYREIDRKRLLYCNAVRCSRCNGAGYLPQYEHVENGICFKCWGEGVALESLE